jgi:hypothetical protein
VLPTKGLVPTKHRRDLVGALQLNPLHALREYCTNVWLRAGKELPHDKPYCSKLHPQTGLPTGDDFHHAVFRMTSSGEGMVRIRLHACTACTYVRLRLHAYTACTYLHCPAVRVIASGAGAPCMTQPPRAVIACRSIGH